MATVDEARKTNEGAFRAISPLFQIALDTQSGQLLNVEAAAKTLKQVLGPNFNEYAVEAFAPQLEALGWLIPEEVAGGRVVYRVSASLPAVNGDAAVESSNEKLDRLFNAFQEFLTDTAPLLSVNLDVITFKWMIFRWATSLDGSDKTALLAHAKALEAGTRPSVKDAFLDETQRFSRIDRSVSIEFAGFVKWLSRRDRAEFDDVASLTELGLALEFIEELRSPSSRDSKDVEATFVLDAPVMLDLFGLSGTSRKESLRKYLDALRVRGGKIATLNHNLDELAEIINTVLARSPSLRFGLTGDAIRSNPELEKLARSIAAQPDVAAKAMGVEVIAFDPHSTLNAQYFPDALIDRFRNSATWHDQSKSEQRQRDALSIAFVMRRRQGTMSSDVLDAKYVLLTRNSTFTRFSEVFARSHLAIAEYAFGPAIEIKTLAAFVWMRFGSDVDPDLPQLQLVSACDRILASNGELMRKAERKIRALKGEDAAFALLASQQAVLDLVISVGGNADIIDAANGEEIVRALTMSAESRGREIERQKADAEQDALSNALRLAEEATERQTRAAAEIAVEKLRREAELREKDAIIAGRDAGDLGRAARVADRFANAARRWARIATAAWWLALILTSVLGQFFVWRGVDWWTASVGNLAWGSVTVAATLALALMGMEVIGSKPRHFGGWLHHRVYRWKIKDQLIGIDDNDERDRVREALRDMGCLSD